MAETVILHAGQHKTGSTSIQRYLEEHQEFLTQHDIAICPDWTADLRQTTTSRVTANAKSVANAIVRSTLPTPLRIRGTCHPLSAVERREGLQRVNAYLHDLPQRTVILSAEALAFLREPEEMSDIEQLCQGMAWRAIMFLREPSSWLASWKTQTEYSGLSDLPQATPGTGIFDFSAESWLVDHQAIHSFWSGHCTFLSYEAALSTYNSVVPVLLAEIGVNPDISPGWGDYYFNSSRSKRMASANPE